MKLSHYEYLRYLHLIQYPRTTMTDVDSATFAAAPTAVAGAVAATGAAIVCPLPAQVDRICQVVRQGGEMIGRPDSLLPA